MENYDEQIAQILQNWDKLQSEIKALFDKRDNRNAITPMKKGIDLLGELMFLTNGLPVSQESEFDYHSLELKPVNLSERLQFLKIRPNIYPSFVQLIELFEEQQKHYAKARAIRKAKRIDN